MYISDIEQLKRLQYRVWNYFSHGVSEQQAIDDFENKILELQNKDLKVAKKRIIASKILKKVYNPYKKDLSNRRTSNERRLEIAKELTKVSHPTFRFELRADESFKIYIENVEIMSACSVCHLKYNEVLFLKNWGENTIKKVNKEIKNRNKIIKHFQKIRENVNNRLAKYTQLTQELYRIKGL